MEDKVRRSYDAVRNFDKKAFRSACYAPSVSLFFTTAGKVLACCKNGSYVLGDVRKESLLDIWNGEQVRELREALKEYRFDLGCSFCEWEISGGNYRTATPLLFDELSVTSDAEWPAMIEFEGSNTCNFECIMCNGDTSSSIRTHRDGLPALPRAYPDHFFEDLKLFLPHLKRARFFGGEPFLTTESHRIWEMMIEQGSDTECHVTTNGSHYNSKIERILDALPFFITVSIDGATKETVERIRINCNYEQLIENIHRFHEYTKRRRTTFNLAFCLMRQNWHEFVDLLLFAENLGCETRVNTVIDPAYCSLYALPRHELITVIQKLEQQGKSIAHRLRLNRGAWDEALLKLKSATEKSQLKKMANVLSGYFVPEDALHKSLALVNDDRYEEALKELSTVPQDHHDYYYVISLSGYVRMMLGDFEGAEADLQKAFQFSTKRPEAFLYLARLRTKQNRIGEALENALRARKLSKKEDYLEYESRELLAILYIRRGRLIRALKNLKPIAKLQAFGSEIQSLVYPKTGLRPKIAREVEQAGIILFFVQFLLLLMRSIAGVPPAGVKAKEEGRSDARRIWQICSHHLALLRLKTERIISKFSHPDRLRVLATACWSFPIYSQTFVYQELAQLIRHGFQLRFLYSKLDARKHLPSQFNSLWKAKRKLELDPVVCQRDYDYYCKRFPRKVNQIEDLICRTSGMPVEELRKHHHFLEAFAFARMAEAYRPDYLHSYFFYEGSLFTYVASALLDIPRGLSSYSDHMLKDYELKLVPLHLQHCNLIIATSWQIKQELLQISPAANPNRIIVKPNAINAEQFPVLIRQEPKDSQPFRLISVSRIEPKKGLVYLIEAVRLLRDRRINVQLNIIGGVDDTPISKRYHQELKDCISELNLIDVVHLEGTKTEDEIKKFLGTSHIFIAPFVQTESGDKDGIPTSLLEAMSSGLPVIATDAGSISEVIEDCQDGILVPQRDPKRLSDAIAELIQDSQKRSWLGNNAQRKIREKYVVEVSEKVFHRRLVRLLHHEKNIAQAKSSKPLVSVITPFLNQARFLEETIESVFAQTHENWELILVDDGSNDGSSDIARRYADRYAGKVFYLEHEGHQNLGAATSRNVALCRAKGKYIAILDGDDVWLPRKLERQVAILESEPNADMVFGASRYWFSWSENATDRDYVPDLGVEPETMYEPLSLVPLLYPLGKGTPPCHSNLLLRRSTIGENLTFEEQFRDIYFLYEDQAFLAKVYLNHRVYISSEVWDFYRHHPDSCVSTVHNAGKADTAKRFFLDWYREYMTAHGFRDSAPWDALQAALENCEPESYLKEAPEKPVEPAHVKRDLSWGTFRRLTPISNDWGFDRGLPIDRYYVEKFLRQNEKDIRGHVLELKDRTYTSKFGTNRITKVDVLHVTEGNPDATIVADLTNGNLIGSDQFDCIIFTQSLHFIYDLKAAVQTLYRILKPGGVLLATVPGITRVSFEEWPDSYLWSFTKTSSRQLFENVFIPGNVTLNAHGNVLTAVSFLHGVAAEELNEQELDYCDPRYEVLITIRAEKPSEISGV